MKLSALFATLVCAFAIGSANASVTFGPTVLDALDAGGAPIADGTTVQVLDIEGDGIGTLNATDWTTTDADDVILQDDFSGGVGSQFAGGFAFPFTVVDFSALNPSTALYVVTLDVPFSAGASGPGASIPYVSNFVGSGFADGNTISDIVVAGQVSETTIPEPASAALALIGAGLLFVRRRNA